MFLSARIWMRIMWIKTVIKIEITRALWKLYCSGINVILQSSLGYQDQSVQRREG